LIENQIQLGKTDIKVSPLGLGTMQWGDREFSNYRDGRIEPNLSDIYRTTIDAGINFFDTAEMYGRGRSELHLGACLKNINDKVIVATKFMPFPWRLSKGELRSALLNSLNRLGLDHIDLYQMHWPLPPVPIRTWMDAMADAVADGLIRAIGVSNYNPNQTQTAFEALEKHHIPLATNQVKYSLLDRRPEFSGLVDLCTQIGVTIIAYSPIERGILTGKYTLNNRPSGFRSWRYNKAYLTKIEILMTELHKIGSSHSDKTPAEVALNWLICKGAVPIPGARNKAQAQDNAGSIGWRLNPEEIYRLDDISNRINR
jgi:aryl-alcohol dehydrogenase-like predicted oxidoreductase